MSSYEELLEKARRGGKADTIQTFDLGPEKEFLALSNKALSQVTQAITVVHETPAPTSPTQQQPQSPTTPQSPQSPQSNWFQAPPILAFLKEFAQFLAITFQVQPKCSMKDNMLVAEFATRTGQWVVKIPQSMRPTVETSSNTGSEPQIKNTIVTWIGNYWARINGGQQTPVPQQQTPPNFFGGAPQQQTPPPQQTPPNFFGGGSPTPQPQQTPPNFFGGAPQQQAQQTPPNFFGGAPSTPPPQQGRQPYVPPPTPSNFFA